MFSLLHTGRQICMCTYARADEDLCTHSLICVNARCAQANASCCPIDYLWLLRTVQLVAYIFIGRSLQGQRLKRVRPLPKQSLQKGDPHTHTHTKALLYLYCACAVDSWPLTVHLCSAFQGGTKWHTTSCTCRSTWKYHIPQDILLSSRYLGLQMHSHPAWPVWNW